MKNVDLDWLRKTNEEFKLQGVTDGENKIWKACQKWRAENVPEILKDKNIDRQIVTEYLNEQDDKIKEYFFTQSIRDRGWITSPFSGVYYFAGHFWEITVPLILGMVKIDLFKCLKMPDQLNKVLFSDKEYN